MNKATKATQSCHCGSGKTFQKCCAPYLKNEAIAATAEILMRARYSAFVEADTAYIMKTHDPATRSQVKEGEIRTWAEGSEWLGLEILKTEKGGEHDGKGVVEFRARYKQAGTLVEHHEVSEFRRIENKWYFSEGRIVGADPVRRTSDKVGRNDPCPCGSGEKYKKCCAA